MDGLVQRDTGRRDEGKPIPSSFLSKEEELRLARAWINHADMAAIQKLAESHMPLARKIADFYTWKSKFTSQDLRSEANHWLAYAARKFDPEQGNRFSTYAMQVIHRGLRNYIYRNHSIVRPPISDQDRIVFFDFARAKKELGYNREGALSLPEAEAVAARLGVRVDNVVRMEEFLARKDKSLNAPVHGDDTDTEYLDELKDESPGPEDVLIENNEYNKRRELFFAAMKNLTEREQNIFLAHRLLGVTYEVLGSRWGVSKTRARQIDARVFEKIQQTVLPQISG